MSMNSTEETQQKLEQMHEDDKKYCDELAERKDRELHTAPDSITFRIFYNDRKCIKNCIDFKDMPKEVYSQIQKLPKDKRCHMSLYDPYCQLSHPFLEQKAQEGYLLVTYISKSSWLLSNMSFLDFYKNEFKPLWNYDDYDLPLIFDENESRPAAYVRTAMEEYLSIYKTERTPYIFECIPKPIGDFTTISLINFKA